jgi:DNA modification methylase
MIHQGDCLTVLKTLPDQSINCCVTSPPYFGLRDYGVDGQIGLEATPEAFVRRLVDVFREVRRVLKDDGTLWLNLGDSYASYKGGKATPDTTRGDSTGTLVKKGEAKNRMASSFAGSGIKNKDLIGIPWRVAFALQADGWYLRQDIIWHKPNPMPESVKDRCTKAHEYIFLLSKQNRYYFDSVSVQEPSIYYGKDKRSGKGNIRYEGKRTIDKTGKNGQDSFVTIKKKKNKRSVWTITTKACKEAHFATFPKDLITPCILAGAPRGGVVLDPFFGSGTTGVVSVENGRGFVGIELNPSYIEIANKRLAGAGYIEKKTIKQIVADL